MMKELMVLLLLCYAASAVKYTLKFNFMISSGVPNLPDYAVTGDFEGDLMAYYESNMKIAEPRQEWVTEFMEDEPQQWETLSENCKDYQQEFTDETKSFEQQNQTGGVHVIQQIVGCEWDDDTKNVNGFKIFGYNGEDFIAFDMKTETWMTSNLLAKTTKQEWDTNKGKNVIWKNFLTTVCPHWLKIYRNYRKPFAHKKVLPSVSLLQKSPSSPVSCHATGFYPDRAMMSWRKDGEELHEGVAHGEILPNNDETFQMSVDLNISSVTAEDWERYHCAFHLSDVSSDIITKLDKAVLRTNEGKTRSSTEKPTDAVIISAAVVVPALIIIAAAAFVVHKKKKKKVKSTPPCADKGSECDGLNTQS